MAEKAQQDLNSFLMMVENSPTNSELLPMTFKERLYQLQSNNPSHSPATAQSMVQHTAAPCLLETLYYLSTFLSFASELDSMFASEYLD